MKKKILLAVSLLLCAAMLSGCAYLPLLGLNLMDTGRNSLTTAASFPIDEDQDTVTISREEYERYQKMDIVLEALDNVKAYFYEDLDDQALIYGAAEGLLEASGDHYTFFYTPEEYAKLWEDDEGEYAGIGIQISSSYITNICTVSRVFENSPAEAAGVHRGDILYKVGDDLYVTTENVNDAVDIMRGTPGTEVSVTFLRGTEEMTFTMQRANVTVNRVSSMMLEDDIGYICLYEFAGDCSKLFAQALQDLTANGAKGIIVDLRDNGGGWVEDAKSIADLFVDEGVLCYLEFNDHSREYYRTTNGKTDVELVILVNENSASASEILTGCLKERAGATVVGKKSFGKGIVQSVIPMSDGAGMQVTIAQYFTPEGNAVHKIGIEPDVEVSLAEGDNGMHELGDLTDAQLAEALKVMQEKLK